MIRTHKIEVVDRVFTIADLSRFAEILDRQASAQPTREFSTKCEATFEDELTIEGCAAEVLNEEELNRPSRPVAIEMRLHGAPLRDNNYIRINLRSGDTASGNVIVVSGDDCDWVNANHTVLLEALRKVQPQLLWWRKHRALLLNLIALGTGTSIIFLAQIPILALDRIWPTHPVTLEVPFSQNMLSQLHFMLLWTKWVLRWGLGLVFAFPIERWLLSMWPSVEFDFGSPYLRLNKRREKLYTVLTLLVLPIIVSAVYDALKLAF